MAEVPMSDMDEAHARESGAERREEEETEADMTFVDIGVRSLCVSLFHISLSLCHTHIHIHMRMYTLPLLSLSLSLSLSLYADDKRFWKDGSSLFQPQVTIALALCVSLRLSLALPP